MFRKNVKHLQQELLSTFSLLPKHMKQYLQKSWAGRFYRYIFSRIDENTFAVLFSDKKSRPNFPINIYIALEIMKWLFDWSDEEMILNFCLNLQVCYAVGIENLGQLTVAPRTIYYNRARIIEHEQKSGVNLFDQVFNNITVEQIQALGIDTSIQRMDSSMISSNIKKMSRLEIAIKVLQNFYRDLAEHEQKRLYERVKEFVEGEANHITFKLKNSELDEQLKRVGELLISIHTSYHHEHPFSRLKSFEHLKRVLDEQFVLQEDNSTIGLKLAEEISSATLQNPADDGATFRRKHNRDYQGYALNIAETCSQDNKTQLITEVSVYSNNSSDEKILAERLPDLKRRTAVEELIVDGGYSGASSEKACDEQKVRVIFTGIKGAKLADEKLHLHDFTFAATGIASCPQGHEPLSTQYNPITARHVAHFDNEQCRHCPLRDRCCVQGKNKFTVLYFNDQHMQVARKRQQFTDEEYRCKQRLRPAIEGTISLFKRRTQNGKLRVRGHKRVENVLILTALAINFRRLAAVVDEIFCLLWNIVILLIKSVKYSAKDFALRRFCPILCL
jgi:hypothetical protein